MYQNFHEFVALLAHSTLALTLVPAGKAFDTYFGATPVQEPETFYAATRWVTTRYSVYTGDVGSRPNQKVRAQWSAWYEAIRLATEGYSKKPDAGNLRLVISGRAALRTMEQVKVRMEREKANAKDGATKTA